MMTEQKRRGFDTEAKAYGPGRNETLAKVEARLERQVTADELVAVLAEFHASAAKYTDPVDFARQVASAVIGHFIVTRRAQ